ncbi:uncharacterized protein K02A2.6-like [Drosophila rhopaloa]|uniref:RNA-directed DNA polymerase n=1 Tax=Drosophila rhopaloa TaxID=1041015 RepID=A0ABM5JCN6_DRORH|nr:uncharacterized protein K02A2.6-like [Drosophila rhopaloa]
MEERERDYQQARERIFGEPRGDSHSRKSSRIIRARRRYQQRKQERREVCTAIISAATTENRAFADVLVANHTMQGLLDTGASKSILGDGCMDLVKRLKLEVLKVRSTVQTAGGATHRIAGRIEVDVCYKQETHRISLLLCPSLRQKLYLGIDFWRKFSLAPDVVGVGELSSIENEFHVTSEPVEPHVLSEEEKTQLELVQDKFLTYERHGMGLTELETHSIQLEAGTVPVKERFYPVSPKVQELLYAEVDEMLRLGVIETSESPWNNRVTLVQKPGKNRLCLDARKLNKVTIKDAYPLQNIESILSRVDETIYISSVDLKHTFWQIELDKKSREYTAFTIPGRPLYQFRRMPFGLCNAAQRLCRLMDRVIPQKLRSNVFVYLDDLLIISKTFKDQPHDRATQIQVLLPIPEVSGFCNRRGVLEDGSREDSGNSQDPSTKEFITDHSSLQWLMTLKDLNGRLARWSLALQAYDFQIEHRKGKDNVVADMLSRIPEVEGIEVFDFETIEFESPEYLERIQTVKENAEQFPDLVVEDGLLLKRIQFVTGDTQEFPWKLWIPEVLTNTLIQQAHNSDTAMHGGIGRTLNRLRQFYYWPKMAIQVKNYVKDCNICKETKHTTQMTRPKMGKQTITSRPMQQLYMDFLGKYPRSKRGNCYILVVLDHLTKFVWLKAMPKATADAVVRYLESEIWHEFGVPEVILTDNGVQFVASRFQSFLEKYQIRHKRTGRYAPQSNASERVNQSVLAAIRIHVGEDHTRWDDKIVEIQGSLRSAVHNSTGVSPYFAMFGQHMFLSGQDYRIARKLDAVNDAQI